ncbi:MAG: DUF433 domain-containing protein [Gammaproteobacteria bacterium]
MDRIKIDPAVCEGRPTTRGLRITVDFVLKLLGDGYSAEDILRHYPEDRDSLLGSSRTCTVGIP